MTPRSGLGLGLVLLLGILAAALPARAGTPDAPDPSALCDAAIAKGARRGGVPVEVLLAVALTETGQHRDGRMRAWPWAINREGKGYWFKTRDEALAFGSRAWPRAPELRRRLRADQLPLARPRLPLARGHVRPRMDGDLCRPVPAHPLRGARQLVRGGRRLPLAHPRQGDDLPRPLRPPPRRTRARRPDRCGGPRRLRPAASRFSSRQARREEQRRAMAEKIRAASPPPAAPGGIAGSSFPPPARSSQGGRRFSPRASRSSPVRRGASSDGAQPPRASTSRPCSSPWRSWR